MGDWSLKPPPSNISNYTSFITQMGMDCEYINGNDNIAGKIKFRQVDLYIFHND